MLTILKLWKNLLADTISAMIYYFNDIFVFLTIDYTKRIEKSTLK